jgi:hypothetical protein
MSSSPNSGVKGIEPYFRGHLLDGPALSAFLVVIWNATARRSLAVYGISLTFATVGIAAAESYLAGGRWQQVLTISAFANAGNVFWLVVLYGQEDLEKLARAAAGE